MKNLFKSLFLLVIFLNSFVGADPKISEIDRIRLAEAFRLNEKLSEKIWIGWNKTPFVVLLVTPENEFLINHPAPDKDFKEIGYDDLLKSKIFWRTRRFNPSFLATFPAVNGVSTVVVGQAENTFVKTSTPWTITLLHEHFHQFQTQGNYYSEVNALDLSKGDTTGMWMLNYAFPYSDVKIGLKFETLCKNLAELLENSTKKIKPEKLSNYLLLRKDLQNALNGSDYRYLSFQAWQEGVSRYTEWQVADLASKSDRTSSAFNGLFDFTSYKSVADEIKSKIVNDLKTMKLAKSGRTSFYSFGAGEALLLDKTNINWKSKYLIQKFYLEEFYPPLK